jgi:hypothetical protein
MEFHVVYRIGPLTRFRHYQLLVRPYIALLTAPVAAFSLPEQNKINQSIANFTEETGIRQAAFKLLKHKTHLNIV